MPVGTLVPGVVVFILAVKNCVLDLSSDKKKTVLAKAAVKGTEQ